MGVNLDVPLGGVSLSEQQLLIGRVSRPAKRALLE